jgi:hypothetical protein
MTEIPDTDPILGFSPDEIVVGPGDQTLAQAAVREQDERVRLACDIATGTVKDPTAVAIKTRGSWRDLNAKGNGSETYRRALSPGGLWRFVAAERLPRGTFLASERGACMRGDVFVGDLIADYERSLRRGSSEGAARHDDKIGLVTGHAPKDAEVEWMDVVRQKDGTWRVILPTGAHLTFAPAGWR